MGTDRKLVLLAVDGSDQSMEMVNYVSKACNLAQVDVVLFHVLDKVPDIFWDWEKDPQASKHLQHMQAWDAHREAKMRDFLAEAARTLCNGGCAADAITTTIQRRNEGIARDILKESQFGYAALAFGRNGLGAVDDAMLGSVASKLLINLTDVNVLLVGGKPKPGKILIGMDNSLGSLRVVNFTARVLAGSTTAVTLAHVIRGTADEAGKLISDDYMKAQLERTREIMEPVFEDAVKKLKAAGIEKVTTKFITGAGSRAVALFDEAKKGRYGSIAVGRRGLSEVQEFHMGRVATKLTQTAKNMAVWIIS
jgi:nucleotide-binding universal stress UspA family protein